MKVRGQGLLGRKLGRPWANPEVNSFGQGSSGLRAPAGMDPELHSWENVLFGRSPWFAGARRLWRACALLADLEVLPGGDQTEIGEKVPSLISLSGGVSTAVESLSPAQIQISIRSFTHSSINDVMPSSVQGTVKADLLLEADL